MPSNQIAKCIATFLTCLDQYNSNDVDGTNKDQSEGSGFDYMTPSKTPLTGQKSTEKNCYKSFQECSGSVILIPDLYNGTTLVNQGTETDLLSKNCI